LGRGRGGIVGPPTIAVTVTVTARRFGARFFFREGVRTDDHKELRGEWPSARAASSDRMKRSGALSTIVPTPRGWARGETTNALTTDLLTANGTLRRGRRAAAQRPAIATCTLRPPGIHGPATVPRQGGGAGDPPLPVPRPQARRRRRDLT